MNHRRYCRSRSQCFLNQYCPIRRNRCCLLRYHLGRKSHMNRLQWCCCRQSHPSRLGFRIRKSRSYLLLDRPGFRSHRSRSCLLLDRLGCQIHKNQCFLLIHRSRCYRRTIAVVSKRLFKVVKLVIQCSKQHLSMESLLHSCQCYHPDVLTERELVRDLRVLNHSSGCRPEVTQQGV
jgi:hypothetical protein